MDIEISGGPNNEVATWDASNRLIGPQIGGRVMFGDTDPGSFYLTADGRVGMLRNSITNSFNLDRSGNAATNDVVASNAANVWSWMLGGALTVE